MVFQVSAPTSANSAVTLAGPASSAPVIDPVSSSHWRRNGDAAGCGPGADMAGADAKTTTIIARGIFIFHLLSHCVEEKARMSIAGRLGDPGSTPRCKAIYEN